ncbi:MAG: type I methionyl aminopeptidase [Candidatus Pacebacteria bacterium]|nr:type I methionyl aminopeptidase [Candidatus Paceibacterota bacterium]
MVSLKSAEEIKIMAEGGKILAKIMKELESKVRPGITTLELSELAEGLILKSGGTCSFLGYNVPDDSSLKRVYPACLCTSVNEEIVHAIPSTRILKEGDIISLDLGIQYKGFHNDMAITVPVGKISKEAQKLIDVTKGALEIGISQIKPGNKIGDLSKAIQKYIEDQGFNAVRELCGHGIGRNIHEDPEILNSVSFDRATIDKVKYFGDAKLKFKEGMVICPEPMVSVGDWHIKKSKDGFGWETKDGSLSCHFEHTVAITKDGSLVLTLR